MSIGPLRRSVVVEMAVLVAILPPLAVALSAASPAPGPAAGAPPAAGVSAGFDDLHEGLFETAEARFRSAARAAPLDPEPPLFVAFTFWWRILEDRSNVSLDEPFHAAISEAIGLGGRLLDARPDDARAMAAVGTAHILKFHIEAIRRNYRKAAQEARQGKRLLEGALERDPALVDAYFALGAYNYYADQIPALAKGMRVILMLPKGDEALGIGQLRTAAESGGHFRTDARLLLAIICSSRDERCYEAALRHLDTARADHPASPLVLGTIGGLQVRLGRYAAAEASFAKAEAASASSDGERVRQRRALRLRRAEALAADWRLEEAAALLASLRLEADALGPRDRRDLVRLGQEIAARRGEAVTADGAAPAAASRSGALITRALAAERAGDAAAALAFLERIATLRPADPLPRFLSGRLLLTLGRHADADVALAAAATLAIDPPPWLEGWLEIYRGMAQAALGKPRAARSHFKRAAEVGRFRSNDRALLELRRADDPVCACGW